MAELPTIKVSAALLALTAPEFGASVKMPSFTIVGTVVTTTGVQFNYLNAATGTTGTTSKKLVFSENPTFEGYVNMPGTGIWDSFGKIGAGTRTPRRKIDSVSTTEPQARLTYTDNVKYVDLQSDSDGNFTPKPSGGVTKFQVADNLSSVNWASRTTGWGIYKRSDNSAGGADFRELYTDELHAKKFIADLEMALAGSQIIAKSVAILRTNVVIPAKGASVSIIVEDLPGTTSNVFADNDWVQLRVFERNGASFTIANAWGQVTFVSHTAASGSEPGFQTYTFARDASDTGTANGETATKGSLVLDYGVTGDGFVETTAIDSAGSPYQQIVTWATKPWTQTVRTRVGNLYGITAVDEWGMVAGSVANSQYFVASDQRFELHGINLSMYSGATEVFKIDRTAPSLAMGSPLPTGYLAGTGIWMGKDGAAYKHRVGSITDGALVKGYSWDGVDFTVKGTVIADAGSFGPWTINADYLAKDTGVDATSAGLAPNDLPFYSGATYANRLTAPFRVNRAGQVNCTLFQIADASLTAEYIPYKTVTGWLMTSRIKQSESTNAISIEGTNGGFIVPVLTTVQRGSILPSNGMIVFDSTAQKFAVRRNNQWWYLLMESA